MKKSILALALLSAVSITSAHAETNYSMYGGLGTTGATVGLGVQPFESVGIRGEFSTIGRQSYSGTDGNIKYKGDVEIGGLGVYADWFPFNNSLRLTAGVLAVNNMSVKAKGRASADGTVNINGTEYAFGGGDYVKAELDYDNAAPYVGIGFGHNLRQAPGFSWYADVGAIFQQGSADLTASPNLVAAAGAANIEAERRKLEKDMDQLNVYPVLKVGVAYSW